jgi:pimeloyl-ACP methyl ester carboxylesterase
MMKRIHCISGLGADERIFRNLSIPGVELVHVKWAPFDKHDEIPCYAQKMSAQIKDDNPTIIGLSFGGMVSVEIAKMRPVDRVFAISSAKTKNELVQGTGSLLSFLIRSRVIPAGLFTMPNAILLKRFGAATDDEKELLTSILEYTDPRFVKWAMRALLEWRNEIYPPNIFHIHGTADKIILPTNIHPNSWVEGGTHMMVYNRAAEISKWIADNL